LYKLERQIKRMILCGRMCDINYFKNIIIKHFNQTYYIFIIIKLHCKRIYIFFQPEAMASSAGKSGY